MLKMEIKYQLYENINKNVLIDILITIYKFTIIEKL